MKFMFMCVYQMFILFIRHLIVLYFSFSASLQIIVPHLTFTDCFSFSKAIIATFYKLHLVYFHSLENVYLYNKILDFFIVLLTCLSFCSKFTVFKSSLFIVDHTSLILYHKYLFSSFSEWVTDHG